MSREPKRRAAGPWTTTPARATLRGSHAGVNIMPPTVAYACLLRSGSRDRRAGGGTFLSDSPRQRPFTRRRIFDARGCQLRPLSTPFHSVEGRNEPAIPSRVFPLKIHDPFRPLLTQNDPFSPCFLGFLRNPLQRFAKGAKLRISQALGLKRPWKKPRLHRGGRRFEPVIAH